MTLFIKRQDNGVIVRINVEADDVFELLGELGIVRQFECANAVRGKLIGRENALHRAQANARRVRQHPPRPVRGFSWGRSERQGHDAINRLRRQRLLARLAGLVAQQTMHAFVHEPFLPTPNAGLRQLRAAHNLVCAAARPRRQDGLGALDVLLLRVAVPDDGIQPKAILGRDSKADPCFHVRSMNCFAPYGNPLNASNH